MVASSRSDKHGRFTSYYEGADILKFIMSIFVVAMHSSLGGGWRTSLIFPFARIAVPVFFLLSSYFFFSHYTRLNENEKSLYLRKFVKRNLLLYAFWFVVLLLPTVYIRSYYKLPLWQVPLQMVRDFLFGSTFVASWYIAATVIAIVIITRLERHLSTNSLLVCSVPCYLFACLTSNYSHVLTVVPTLSQIGQVLSLAFGAPHNNFVVAIFWCALGKALEEWKTGADWRYGFARKYTVAGVLLGLLILIAEQAFVRRYDLAESNDCYLTLPLTSICLTVLALEMKAHIPYARWMRTASTITYCWHGTFIAALHFLLRHVFPQVQDGWGVLVFSMTCIASWVLTAVILRMERLTPFKWLRYSH